MDHTTALLVVDAQVNMFAESSSVFQGERLLQTLRDLIAKGRSLGVPVIYVQNNGGEGDPDQHYLKYFVRKFSLPKSA